MTTPIASGYPDFGRYQAQATKLYAKASLANQNADVVVPLGYVGDVANIGVTVTPTTNDCVVLMDFTNDAAGTIIVGNHTYSARANDIFARSVPVLGPYCTVTFILPTTPAGFDYTFTQAAAPYASLDNSSRANVLLSGVDITVAAGVTLIDAGRVRPGPAAFFARMGAANVLMDLQAISATGAAVTFLARVEFADNNKTHNLYLPAQHIRLRVVNGTGVNQLVHYSVTTDLGFG